MFLPYQGAPVLWPDTCISAAQDHSRRCCLGLLDTRLGVGMRLGTVCPGPSLTLSRLSYQEESSQECPTYNKQLVSTSKESCCGILCCLSFFFFYVFSNKKYYATKINDKKK